MPALSLDQYSGALMGLSGVNGVVLCGGGDSTWSGNSTVTAVKAALRALAPTAGASPDLVEKVCTSLQIGVNTGLMAETHTATSTATARALFTPSLPDVPASYTGALAQ